MTPRYSPELNGVAERMNRTLAEASMSLLIESNLPFDFLCDAIEVAVHCRNRLYTKAVKNKTPYEVFHGKAPTYGHLKVFGCESWAHIPSELCTKFCWDIMPQGDAISYLKSPVGKYCLVEILNFSRF